MANTKIKKYMKIFKPEEDWNKKYLLSLKPVLLEKVAKM
jgi:hypothetical protein